MSRRSLSEALKNLQHLLKYNDHDNYFSYNIALNKDEEKLVTEVFVMLKEKIEDLNKKRKETDINFNLYLDKYVAEMEEMEEKEIISDKYISHVYKDGFNETNTPIPPYNRKDYNDIDSSSDTEKEESSLYYWTQKSILSSEPVEVRRNRYKLIKLLLPKSNQDVLKLATKEEIEKRSNSRNCNCDHCYCEPGDNIIYSRLLLDVVNRIISQQNKIFDQLQEADKSKIDVATCEKMITELSPKPIKLYSEPDIYADDGAYEHLLYKLKQLKQISTS